MKLSILMPVYNEASTVVEAIDRVLGVEFPVPTELIIVDDGSSDGTREVLDGLDRPGLVVHHHGHNQGKGAAVRTAASHATGDYLIVCDADLEYYPEQIPDLLQPVLDGKAEVVFGTRSFGSHTAYSFWYVLGNRFVTMAANVLFNCWISDLETCFKLVPVPVYRELNVVSSGFGMEAELTGKLLKRGIRPYEIPITYQARSREEGKKITWRDGVAAIFILAGIRFRVPLRTRA
jgi:glycosyltransferase involved in cell wall biosynthesis